MGKEKSVLIYIRNHNWFSFFEFVIYQSEPIFIKAEFRDSKRIVTSCDNVGFSQTPKCYITLCSPMLPDPLGVSYEISINGYYLHKLAFNKVYVPNIHQLKESNPVESLNRLGNHLEYTH